MEPAIIRVTHSASLPQSDKLGARDGSGDDEWTLSEARWPIHAEADGRYTEVVLVKQREFCEALRPLRELIDDAS
jgi:hypothetical protein